MKIENNLLKDDRDVFLVKTTALINQTNPVVDRIMEDDTVDTVIMANKEGAPILTNINVASATRYAVRMRRLGVMVQSMLMELDPFDEALVFRLNTLKREVLVAPDKEFSIIVVQQDRKKRKAGSEKKKNPKLLQ